MCKERGFALTLGPRFARAVASLSLYSITLLHYSNSSLRSSAQPGAGKTTQVPQYGLEDASERGEPGNIIVAQPRRISAMSVAERVAAERGEMIGGTIGYTIRLESKVRACRYNITKPLTIIATLF